MIFLVGIPVALGLFSVYVATRPGGFRIARSHTVDAPPSAVFPLINDFHEWAAWSPFERMDASMTKTYEGPAAGVGAGYGWTGNNKVGEGSMKITESVEPTKVVIALAFKRPMVANNVATFTLEAKGEGTEVTWAMEGVNSFLFKAFNVLLDSDKMVGKDFERGLKTLGELAVKRAAKGSEAAA